MNQGPIVLVEDNKSDEKLALLAFKKANVVNDIIVARDGVEALDRLFAADARAPALVLLDLKLPKVDGLEVLRRLRADARTRLLPVVVLTASKEDEDLVKSYTLGANAYVRKPVDFAEFAAATQTLAAFWLRLNEVAPARGGPHG